MTQVATDVSRRLRDLPGVANTGAHVGRAITGDQTVDVNSSEVWVSIDSGADYDATLASVDDVVRRVPAVGRDVVTYSTQKIRDVGALNEGANRVRGDGLDLLTGVDAPLVVRVYGQDSAVLRREAEKVRAAIAGVDGVVDPRLRLPATEPSVEIEVDLARAQRLGIKPGDVRRAEATLLQGIQVGSVFQKQKVFDVIVQGVPATRRSVVGIRDLLIDRPGGGHARLGDVADVRIAPAPVAIEREAVSRRVDVEAGVSGRSAAAVAGDVEDRLAALDHPLEYHAEVVRATTGGEIGATRMLAFLVACLIATVLLLQAAFQSWRLALLAFVTLPVGLVGGLFAALIDGAELTLGSLAGLLALFALAVRSGVLLIRGLQDLERDGEPFGAGLVERGARERLGPALTTTCGLAVLALPFVVLGSEPGLEIVHPMAVVLLGGLVTTAFLSLFALPALYLRFGRGAGPGPARGEDEELVHRWMGVEPEPAATGAPATADAGRETTA
jgi:Cu/Ag efflux pump CusA